LDSKVSAAEAVCQRLYNYQYDALLCYEWETAI